MPLKEELIVEVSNVVRGAWSTRDGRVVPAPEDLQLGNHGVNLDATVLYADLAGSTVMVDSRPVDVAAEVYKIYMICAARIIKGAGGTITAYDGDRIMAVFLGSSKNTTAARTALQITWALIHIVNPALREQYGNFAYQAKHVVGIDTSILRACRIGVRNDNDLVWVGPAANHAAKLSSIMTDGSAVFLSEAVYRNLHESLIYGGNLRENMWTQTTEWQYGRAPVYRSSWWWSL